MMKYSINQILADVLNDRPLDDQQKYMVARHLERIEVRKAKEMERKMRIFHEFHMELCEVLRKYPNTAFTATEIQLLLPDAIQRRISVQRVARHLGMMTHGDYGVQNCRVLLHNGYVATPTTMWFVGKPEIEKNHWRDMPQIFRSDDFWEEILSK